MARLARPLQLLSQNTSVNSFFEERNTFTPFCTTPFAFPSCSATPRNDSRGVRVIFLFLLLSWSDRCSTRVFVTNCTFDALKTCARRQIHNKTFQLSLQRTSQMCSSSIATKVTYILLSPEFIYLLICHTCCILNFSVYESVVYESVVQDKWLSQECCPLTRLKPTTVRITNPLTATSHLSNYQHLVNYNTYVFNTCNVTEMKIWV